MSDITDVFVQQGLLEPIFVTETMAKAFGDKALVQSMLDVESALAEAEAELGLIPWDHIASISEACRSEDFDISAIGIEAAAAGNPVIPLVKALTAKVPEDAAGSVHWGATSQDILDTALMMMMRDGLQIIIGDLARTIEAGIGLAETHQGALLPGRTFMQHALPIPFSHKVATWLAGLVSARVSTRRILAQDIALQFAGAAGTLASLGDKGVAVRGLLAIKLKLNEPHISWQGERSRVASIGAGLGLVSGTVSNIATDILLMSQSEIGEAQEPAAEGRGGSSTMPHKRNPVAMAAIRANHRRTCGLVASLLMAMEGEHERSAGAWSAEWETIRDLFRLCGGGVHMLADVLEGLEIYSDRMLANINAADGYTLAESLMMALAPRIGRKNAYDLVADVVRVARRSGQTFQATALEDGRITKELAETDIVQALDPKAYLGTSESMTGAVLAEARQELKQS